ncbi:competence protein CoiA [Aquibacillus albus]|uniref:Competence CoiA-like predicted nuclease n=1 Tax=Aquibacillus albus TaxID=1168171 RepID=A0ABS2N059_9BACI|nr:competence protein CoiA family protein [Aquibacillus albus]MBM7571539.1 competence CoiA-like predicted nuclease [Aquibacillus albus]
MLQALDQQGELLLLSKLSHQEINKYKKNGRFYCPVCKEKVILKSGTKVIPHFSHRPNSTCANHSSGEGEYHERGKLQLYDWFIKQGIDATLETYLPDIKQRSDILLRINKKVIAIEFQCARMTETEFLKRNNGYHQQKITPIWILGGTRMNRIGKSQVSLGHYELLFQHQFSVGFPSTIYFYCSNTKKLSIIQHVQSTGRKKAFASISFHELASLPFKRLFSPTAFPLELYTNWLQEKHRWRLNPTLYLSKKEKNWRDWLYVNFRLYPCFLPSIIHLPVPSQFAMNSSPWIWQSILYLDVLLKNEKVSLKQCYIRLKDHFSSSYFPLIKATINPIHEYLVLLEKLQFITCIEDSYMLIKKANVPNTIETGIKDDREIIDKIICTSIGTNDS